MFRGGLGETAAKISDLAKAQKKAPPLPRGRLPSAGPGQPLLLVLLHLQALHDVVVELQLVAVGVARMAVGNTARLERVAVRDGVDAHGPLELLVGVEHHFEVPALRGHQAGHAGHRAAVVGADRDQAHARLALPGRVVFRDVVELLDARLAPGGPEAQHHRVRGVVGQVGDVNAAALEGLDLDGRDPLRLARQREGQQKDQCGNLLFHVWRYFWGERSGLGASLWLQR